MLETLDRLGVDRRVFCETYLSLSLSSTIPARPRSATETAHRQRRVVQYGDDGVVVVLGRRRHDGDGEVAEVARGTYPLLQRPLSDRIESRSMEN